jgi:thiosulfate sulfurtransferase
MPESSSGNSEPSPLAPFSPVGEERAATVANSSWILRTMVVAIIVAGIGTPLALYWLLPGGIPTATPQEAKDLLGEDRPAAVLVDVRTPESFAAGHIEGAVNWTLDEVRTVDSPDHLRADLHGKTLLVICDVGMASRAAVWHLRHVGLPQALNVRGGVQEWMRSAPAREGCPWDRWRTPSGVGSFPFRESPMIEQALAVASYFLVKPIYMLLSLAVVAVLWRARSGDLVALRWGMVFFFLGETACAVNYFGFKETSYLWEYLHGAGMFVCFGFVAYAVMESVDHRILGLSDPDRRCAAARLCGACIKNASVPCGLKRSFYLVIASLIVVAMMVPTAGWRDNSYNTLIFGEAYNYGHLRVFQQVENWYCPAAAVAMFAISLAILLVKRDKPIGPAKIALAAGLGPLGFGMFRMLLGAAYDQNRVWFLFWEETTELLLVLGTCCLLWIFRRGLFPGFDRWLQSLLSSLK